MSIGICLRFLQGLGDSLVSTSGNFFLPFFKYILGYSIITIEFPTKKETYIGYCQAAVGIGLMLGPVLGQALFSVVSFEKTFYIFGAVLSIAMVILVIVIPNNINHADDIMSRAEIDQYFERLKSTEARSSSHIY